MAECPAKHSSVRQVTEGLRAARDEPRRLAEELIRGKLGDTGPFLGEGTAECPWIVFDRSHQFYALCVQERELRQKVQGRHDEVVARL